MASIPYQEIVSSDSFKFLVGSEKKPYFLHSALVADQSRALNALVNSGMRESKERCAVWEHIDEQTFLRFSQFAYTGDYTGAAPSEDKVERRNLSSARILPIPDPKVYGNVRTSSIWTNFVLLFPDTGLHLRRNGATDDYSEVFLSHARMYFFAEYYAIAKLQSLALQKLHRALVLFTPYRERIGDILKLIRYCYEDRALRESESHIDVKFIVSMYTAVRIEDLWQSEEFQSIVETIGDYSKGLVHAMLMRLAPV
ncbi:hypothetical protein jhhlp_006889 [Lomentospora prolificans]|uniref:BTB domain-containing protein n=1 Tax=Lomentospora prolificans TaxID=41688 RepID=A0A2N3N326_9PEZI|nr:hypothetical protein jhhlp_006889 [Lomentospora prolificans]